MRLSQLAHRLSRKSFRAVVGAANFRIDMLEGRRLLTGTGETVTPIPPTLASSNASITLDQYFNNPNLPGTLATFTTSYGDIYVALSDAATPKTVANFLSYVNSGAYTNTIFHRSVDLATNLGGEPGAPATIIQGGGYNLGSGGIAHIPVNSPVVDEYTTEIWKDVAGTLAMAKTSSADSATSEWYFNVSDNTELDTPTQDPSTGAETSYTVFGNVLSGQSVLNTIAALPTYNLGGALTTVPITGLSQAQLSTGANVTASNLVYTDSITTKPGTNYNVSSDNPSLVTPVVSNGVLSFTYGSGKYGTADITITGTNIYDNTSATTTFAVTVPNPATPTAGPVAAPYTAPFTVTGTTGTFSVVSPDTDSTAPLNPATIAIVTAPTHGTATVNSSNGDISYTPTPGYLGPDSLTYTISDSSGATSAPGTVTLDAVPTAVALTIGAGKTLVFTQPDGTVGHLHVTGGAATVTFTDYRVTTRTAAGVLFATGAGATITSVTIANAHSPASLSVGANAPVSLGSVSDPGELLTLSAPQATLSGNCSIGVIRTLNVGALVGATLTVGALPGGEFTNLLIPSATNSDVTAGGNLGLVRSKQWLVNDGLTHQIEAAFISNLMVTGEFDNDLNLLYRISLAHAKVGEATGTWNINGLVANLSLGTPGANWKLTTSGLIEKLAFTGNFANYVTAAAINALSVKGTTNSATIQTDGGFSPRFLQIGRLSFGGAVTSSVVFANGSIGAITAPSLTSSRIYAGVNISVAQNGTLATSSSDIASTPGATNTSAGTPHDARVGAISLGRGANVFSNSLVSADILGHLSLGQIASDNGGTAEGISAHIIGSVSGTLVPGGVIKAGPAQLKSAAALTAYETKKKLALGDFQIDLF